MSECGTKINISCNVGPFRKFVRKAGLDIYKVTLGWRRFFCIDWWLLFLCLLARKNNYCSIKG